MRGGEGEAHQKGGAILIGTGLKHYREEILNR